MYSNVAFSFQGLLQADDDIQYTTISVMNAQLPISWYTVNSSNNTLIYSINNVVSVVTFTVGNYNANSFIAEFKSKMPAAFNCTLNRVNGKFQFTHATSNFKFLGSSTCCQLLGFMKGIDYSSTSNVLTPPYPCNFSGVSRIRIASDELSTYTMDSYTGNFSNTLQTLSVNSGAFGVLLYENNHNFKAILRNKTINYFDVQIYDDNEQLIDFNGIHWSLTLQIDIVRTIGNGLGKIAPSATLETSGETQGNNVQDQQHEQNLVDLPVTTGDDDLDFLLFVNGTYQ